MGKAPRISLCMIVKNEEDSIGRCLNSVRDVVDEIIIVDTGSTDRTIEICKSYHAQIERFVWNNSFADARNYGIEKATGEWIIWLDADEEVDKKDIYKIQQGTHFVDYDVLTIHLVNFYGDKADKFNTTDIAHTRLFRRSKKIRFINKIHEHLNVGNIPQERIGHLDVKVYHYGYLDSHIKKKNKYERNMKMLKQQLKDQENVFWAQYYIALEHYRNEEFQEAFEAVNKSIKAFLEKHLLPPSMVYKLKYSILIALKSFEGAWPGIEKAIALYPDYVDLHFFKGVILYYLEKYEASLESFEKCIELGEDNIHHLILKGVGSFQAWHYKGICQRRLNRTDEAIISLMQALAISPTYHYALDSLKEMIKENNISLMGYLEGNFNGEDYRTLRKLFEDENLINN